MKFVKVNEVKTGDKIKNNIYYNDGRIMLKNGVVLTDNLIKHLLKMNLNGLYIEDPFIGDVQIDDGLGQDLRLKGVSILHKEFNNLKENGTCNIKPLIDLANSISDSLIVKPDFIYQLKDIRNHETYLYSHSINVCALSVLTAKSLGYNTLQIKEVAVGSLLHDIGYTNQIMKDPFMDHPLAGFEILRKFHEVSLKSSHIALQHHEMINGNGFPRMIKDKEFLEYAQICSIANDFDHFVNGVDNNLPHIGIEFIMTKAMEHYRMDIVQSFVKNIAPYPIGTSVKLSNGELGVVINVDKSYPTRPLVKVFDSSIEIDLFKNITLFVQEVLIEKY